MKAIIWDTETSGLIDNRTRPIDKQPEVIEFYACYADLKTGKITRDLNLLIKPQDPLTEENIARHNITNEMLSKAPPFAKVADGIVKFFKTSPLAIAHNASFDKEMLEIEFERLGKPLTLPRMICSIEQTMQIKGHRLNLSALHEYLFGEPFDGAHRAKVDVMALLKCCVELHKRDML
jgi:DNA polymerase III epsilon subunit-like protein